MQTPEKIVVDDRALIGWYMMSLSDREKVLETLEGLAGQSPDSYPADMVQRWRPDRDLFAYHLPSPEGEMLVFFYPRDGRLHIDSLAPRDRVDLSTGRKA